MTMRVLAAIMALYRDRRANAAVEFAILVPVLLVLVTGTIDLGLGFQEKIKLQSALNSGMQHVMQTQGGDIAITRQVIIHGLGPGSAVELDVNTFCRCGSAALACTQSCAAGRDRFAMASVALPYRTPIFDVEMNLAANFEVYVGKVE